MDSILTSSVANPTYPCLLMGTGYVRILKAL
jgi:hypothetical protein